MPEHDLEILLLGPEDLESEMQIVEETTADFGSEFGYDTHATRPEDWTEPTLLDKNGVTRDPRGFEAQFDYGRGLKVDDLALVLGANSLNPENGERHHAVYVTDKPLWIDDGHIYEPHGVANNHGLKGVAVLSNFPYNHDISPEMFSTLTAHEYGHLFQHDSSVRRPGDPIVGDGHCSSGDVMSSESLETLTSYMNEDDLYCGSCRQSITNTLEMLLDQSI